MGIIDIAIFPVLVMLPAFSSFAATESFKPKQAQVTHAAKIGSDGQMGMRSRNLTNDQIAKQKSAAERQVAAETIEEALSAVEDTREALRALNDNDTAKATSALELALGKIDVVLAKRPSLALVPTNAEVTVIDFVGGDREVRAFADQLRSLVNNRSYQAARKMVRNFASEINITTTNLPMATFPAAIRDAVRLIAGGKIQDAKGDLTTALNSLVLVERSIPLPILRAIVLLDDVNRQLGEKKFSRDDANTMLNEANLQLGLAEEFGYGSRREDFVELQRSILRVKNNLDKGQGILSKLVKDLHSIKERVF